MDDRTADPRIFVSFAARDPILADALVDFLRLGCDLREGQVFCTARPGTLPPGTLFTDAVREALDTAAMSVHVLTPAYYESHFCLGELGAAWIAEKGHVPLIVPPVEYATLDGVQLGEQALKIDRSGDLDQLRDYIRELIGVEVPTAQWNRQKEMFLTKWDTELKDSVSEPDAIPGDEHRELAERAAAVQRALAAAEEARDRLQRFSRELKTQNEQLRERVKEAPPPPELEERDEAAQGIAQARAAIEVAQKHMGELPAVVREGLFQYHHDGRPLTVGGIKDRYSVDEARKWVEHGYLTWVEDEPQMVTPRTAAPEVDEADSAVGSVREMVFGGASWDSRAEAGPWIRPLLKEEFGIADPTFELRPVWEALGFL
jgi:hypothetical protein